MNKQVLYITNCRLYVSIDPVILEPCALLVTFYNFRDRRSPLQFLQFNEFHPSSNYEIVRIIRNSWIFHENDCNAKPYWSFLKMFDIRKAVAPPFQRRPIASIFVRTQRQARSTSDRSAFLLGWMNTLFDLFHSWVGWLSIPFTLIASGYNISRDKKITHSCRPYKIIYMLRIARFLQ